MEGDSHAYLIVPLEQLAGELGHYVKIRGWRNTVPAAGATGRLRPP